MRTHHVAFLCGILMLVAPTPGSAQEVAGTFSELKSKIRQGERVTVTDSAGQLTNGRLVDLSDTAVDIRLEHATSMVPFRLRESDVNNIVVTRFDPIWNGALIGLAIGAGAGAMIELGGKTEYQKFSGSGAISMGAITLIAGLLVDIFNKDRAMVFVHRPQPTSPVSAPGESRQRRP
jgi:hypothetical protein